MTIYKLPLSYDRPPLTLNQRLHWAQRHRATAALIEEIGWRARAEHIPATTYAMVQLVWQVTDRRRRDADNPVPTSKACVDGLVRAGVLPDDSPDYVTHLMPRIQLGDRRALWLEVKT